MWYVFVGGTKHDTFAKQNWFLEFTAWSAAHCWGNSASDRRSAAGINPSLRITRSGGAAETDKGGFMTRPLLYLCAYQDLNLGPPACHAGALTI